jgi:hypothetical protein
MIRMRRFRLGLVSDRILSWICDDPRAVLLRELQTHDGQIYVLAGAVRDALALEFEGTGTGTPRDIDVAISGVSRDFFDSVVQAHATKNRHGGYVLAGQGAPSWDVWRLEESIGLRKTGTACSVESVLRTFNLDCNAVALELRTGTLIDAGASEAIRKRQVGFVPDAIVHSEATFAAKALLSQLRFSYTVDIGLQKFVAKYLTGDALLHESLKAFPGLVVLPRTALRSSQPKRTADKVRERLVRNGR